MSTLSQPRLPIHYPDSDGQPMAENTLQFEWIVTIKENLDVQFRDDANVFVAGDLLWYPVEGHPEISTAPDTLVAFGRPKGYRGSYLQWEEGGSSPQVTFEVFSPSNRPGELTRKFQFYERYGIEEYYLTTPTITY
jgi:Uma2 family endonuclease